MLPGTCNPSCSVILRNYVFYSRPLVYIDLIDYIVSRIGIFQENELLNNDISPLFPLPSFSPRSTYRGAPIINDVLYSNASANAHKESTIVHLPEKLLPTSLRRGDIEGAFPVSYKRFERKLEANPLEPSYTLPRVTTVPVRPNKFMDVHRIQEYVDRLSSSSSSYQPSLRPPVFRFSLLRVCFLIINFLFFFVRVRVFF